MRKTFIFFAILVFTFSVNAIFAQHSANNHKQKMEGYFDKPFFTIDAKSSFDISAMDLRGNSVKDFWDFTSYGMNEGLGAEINFKMSVINLKDSQFRTYLTIAYTQFSVESNKAYVPTKWVDPGWPTNSFTGTGEYIPSDTSGTSRLRLNMPYCALGMEYAQYLDRKNRSSINFGFDFNMNIIWGKELETYAHDDSAGMEVEHNMNAQPRVGLGLFVALHYRFIETFGFNAGIRYHFANLIGKNDSEADPSGKIYLLDKGDSSLSPLLNESRLIGYYKFFLGVSFFIGSVK